jgi:hypothetical protein
MYAGRNSGLGDVWSDLSTNLPGILAGTAAIVQATRPQSPPAGVTSSYGIPSGMGPAIGVTPSQSLLPPMIQPAGSFLSDPVTLMMIAAGALGLILILKR